jgi:protoheme IX farnesyltransferase
MTTLGSPAVSVRRCALADYVDLTKPRITLTVVLTAIVGYVVAAAELPAAGLVSMAVGTGLVAAGASVLNMILERRTDGLMLRTCQRPLPAGRVRPGDALGFGLVLTAAGLTVLNWLCGPVSALVALVTWASYLFGYTPLKTRTSLSTVVGAFPGAMPPVIGWAAARGTIEPGAVVLFAMLFLWQIPHFLAIAWIYREDYARAGLPMLPVVDPEGRLTGRQAVAHSLALLLVSLTPALAGMAGRLYFTGAIVLGLGLSAMAVRVAVLRDLKAARGLFLASLAHLTLLSVLLILDRP